MMFLSAPLKPAAAAAPQTSDEFNEPSARPGSQWQWNAHPRPRPGWVSLTVRPGFLRLACVPAPTRQTLYDAPNLLLQKFPAPAFVVTTSLHFTPRTRDECAGLIVFGQDYAWIGLRRTDSGLQLVLAINRRAHEPGSVERIVADVDGDHDDEHVYLRVTVAEDAGCRFAYSYDNHVFIPIGDAFAAGTARRVGAKIGLFASAAPDATRSGHADFDWFRVSAS